MSPASKIWMTLGKELTIREIVALAEENQGFPHQREAKIQERAGEAQR